jgi:hypothetical protein
MYFKHMPTQESLEALQYDLDELRTVLCSLEVPGRSNKGLMDSLGPRKLAQVTELAEAIVYACQPDHMVRLTVGKRAISAYRPDFGTADIKKEQEVRLKPGSTLIIDRFKRLFEAETCNLNLYFSDETTAISLGSAALNLRQGGDMSFVDSDLFSEDLESK